MQEFYNYNQTISQNIRKFRLERGFSQEYLAELIDRSREHISRLETGKESIGLSSFIRLAQIFDVSLDEFAGYKL